MTIRKTSILINTITICLVILAIFSHFFEERIPEITGLISLEILLLIAVFNLLYNYFFIVKPLLTTIGVFQKIVIDDKTDLGKRINIKNKNEIGTAANFFNLTFDNISELVAVIKNKTNAFTNTGFELSANMSKTSMAVKRISMNLKKMNNLIDKQKNEANETNKTLEQIKINIADKKVSLSVVESLIQQTEEFINTNKEAADCMNDIVSAVNQVNTAINHVNDLSNENSKNLDTLKQEMEKFTDSGGSRNKKILLVDDDELHLYLTENMLKNEYDVICTKSGEEAMGLFYKGLVPDLILLDLVMPDMDGWDVYERVKAIGALHEVPIAFFSGTFEIEDIKRAFDIGVNEYISKPVEKEDFLKTVSNLLKSKK